MVDDTITVVIAVIRFLAVTMTVLFLRLIGTVITGVFNPDVPAFWPYTEVGHLENLPFSKLNISLVLFYTIVIINLFILLSYLPSPLPQTYDEWKVRLAATEDDH